ncbi:universal stress protein [Salinigranum rubrum]|uniref:Universal stress protein n=1 Tax=Salinigranum rubrum TaxID=755307 RepID=A0A2I8VH87_9EURY|nr:universal stress protein [Salinigranum rubrum]AUV81288.1 universal stress protein [Salinigranum rubrum]
MYARLLVPTDGSRGTDRVVDRALGLATRFDAHVDALSVVDETFPATSEYNVVVETREDEAEAALEAVVEACERAGVGVEPHLRRGRPHEEIVAAVDAYGSDLIVMGTHGRRGLDRIRHLGSVTERVVRTSPVPVLTTPLTVEEGDEMDDEDGAGVSDGAGANDEVGSNVGAGANDGTGEYR